MYGTYKTIYLTKLNNRGVGEFHCNVFMENAAKPLDLFFLEEDLVYDV